MSRSVFGIDFGTSTIKIYNGLTKTVITEKDIIAIKNKTQLFEFGDEALKMYESYSRFKEYEAFVWKLL